mmetsp:Transcript_75038/g.87127  ORF Transcript_75038/g.87127 Transcript_75038/m.87127 type:complete len:186 (-) Transcript_75038:159-716(-)
MLNQSIKDRSQAKIRDPAPDFETMGYFRENVETISLKSYHGKYVVLFWYPSVFLPNSSAEIVAFSERVEEFNKLKCQVIGASTDFVGSQVEYLDNLKSQGTVKELKIPLISDSSLEIAKAYGCLMEKEGIAFRATYIIDNKGIIRHMAIDDLNTVRNLDEILRLIAAFQYSDEVGEECPADWQRK